MLAHRLTGRAQLGSLLVVGVRQARELVTQVFKPRRLSFGKLAAFALFLIEAIKGTLCASEFLRGIVGL
ncbi:Uncharacterised protein [Klebsiella pneumoniae]|nr:Uncharacterised protein [Klebsiella pneumoniae]